MPSKKGIGGKKGKGKAPRPPAKRTRSRSGSSSDDGDRPDFSAFLARLQAAELERGIVSPQVVPSPATGTGGVGRSLTRKQSQERLWSSISARLDAIEASSSSNAQSQPHSNREDTSNTPQTPASGPSVAMPANSNQLSPGILQPPLSDLRLGLPPVRVLVCGHSFIFWAGRRAARTSMGSQLGLSRIASVQWLGKRGMKWEHLLNTLFQQRVRSPPPQVLLVHLGGNDLGLLKSKALILQVIADFNAIRQRWPETMIIWSCMLPRLNWRAAKDQSAMEKARREVNRQVYKDLLKFRDVSIQHPLIVKARRELYREDGVHLSDHGNDLFLWQLQKGLQDAILCRWGEPTKP
ncbi:uncharacterized protein LOC134402235 isoform X1 [Elgaria multicarinata webbii]|uniref:uncharacterized protein LOC134402235 isoform X1 n=1 Tax=Elgaria multicarinata webbii TaxID=159646 RepID=UPI002FCD4FF8